VTVAAYGTVFGASVDVPVAYTVLPVAAQVALRFSTRLAAWHVALGEALVLGLTVLDPGPFIGPDRAQALLLAQSFLAVAALLTLLLAMCRDERESLLQDPAEGNVEAQTEAALLDAVFESIRDGVTVVDPTGRYLMVNSAARSLFGAARLEVGQRSWATPDRASAGGRQFLPCGRPAVGPRLAGLLGRRNRRPRRAP